MHAADPPKYFAYALKNIYFSYLFFPLCFIGFNKLGQNQEILCWMVTDIISII